MARVRHQDLLLVSKAKKTKLDSLATGASLVERTGYSVPQLVIKSTKDRIEFARTLLVSAELAIQGSRPVFRSAVSRAYYSMYHSCRAVSYYIHGGDDHEEHSKLPSNIPHDFPDHSHWENNLKRARYERNRADYDPYPKKDRLFETAANDLIDEARILLPMARKYLRQKGCNL